MTFAGSPVIDEEGIETYAGLALGAAYKVIVPPLSFEGVPLAYYQDAAVRIAGFGTFTDIISMSDLAPGNNPYGLYVTAISNSVSNQIDPTGTLTITFSRPVTKTGSFYAVENSGSGVIGVPGATATLSADGLTLTLTPNWITPPNAGETNTTITYTSLGLGGFISVQGYPDSSYELDTLVNEKGNAISLAVHLTTPTP